MHWCHYNPFISQVVSPKKTKAKVKEKDNLMKLSNAGSLNIFLMIVHSGFPHKARKGFKELNDFAKRQTKTPSIFIYSFI